MLIDAENFHGLTEESIEDLMRESALEESEFECIKQDILNLYTTTENSKQS